MKMVNKKKGELKKVTQLYVYCYEKCTKISFSFFYEIYIFKNMFYTHKKKFKANINQNESKQVVFLI